MPHRVSWYSIRRERRMGSTCIQNWLQITIKIITIAQSMIHCQRAIRWQHLSIWFIMTTLKWSSKVPPWVATMTISLSSMITEDLRTIMEELYRTSYIIISKVILKPPPNYSKSNNIVLTTWDLIPSPKMLTIITTLHPETTQLRTRIVSSNEIVANWVPQSSIFKASWIIKGIL